MHYNQLDSVPRSVGLPDASEQIVQHMHYNQLDVNAFSGEQLAKPTASQPASQNSGPQQFQLTVQGNPHIPSNVLSGLCATPGLVSAVITPNAAGAGPNSTGSPPRASITAQVPGNAMHARPSAMLSQSARYDVCKLTAHSEQHNEAGNESASLFKDGIAEKSLRLEASAADCRKLRSELSERDRQIALLENELGSILRSVGAESCDPLLVKRLRNEVRELQHAEETQQREARCIAERLELAAGFDASCGSMARPSISLDVAAASNAFLAGAISDRRQDGMQSWSMSTTTPDLPVSDTLVVEVSQLRSDLNNQVAEASELRHFLAKEVAEASELRNCLAREAKANASLRSELAEEMAETRQLREECEAFRKLAVSVKRSSISASPSLIGGFPMFKTPEKSEETAEIHYSREEREVVGSTNRSSLSASPGLSSKVSKGSGVPAAFQRSDFKSLDVQTPSSPVVAMEHPSELAELRSSACRQRPTNPRFGVVSSRNLQRKIISLLT
eukprot:gnl/MRDRNA2_/MRDRNA2_35831_c0_seq1.p1 gnl/MRDRNA2_/MRDRNA2_35831_c0~~gnl/MRDRNA2_/MRDRNA2_35831_c0_seq1.p1  ORF type:complete len:504 (-),score=98.37 gnl/MRDRNA2_/MRDRNA2_35831_c0_seq1:107-1618(-)